MRSVLISIKPKWCELIASGKKTIEVRKTKPKLETPFKCYIYCTNTKPYLVWGDVFRGDWETEFTHLSGYNRKEAEKIWDVFNGHVIGEFVCDSIEEIGFSPYNHGEYICKDQSFVEQSCVPFDEMFGYLGDGYGYGWHISNLFIYDEPKKLSEFYTKCNEVCEDCYLWRYVRVNSEEFDMECASEFYGHIPLKRPPQSWCYVEEM